jgi:hypothetical protein
MISPVLVGAELVCRARLAQAKVTGMGRPDDIVQALQSAAWGEGATWSRALGEALGELLSRLVDSGGLALEVQVDEPTPEIAEMQIAALRRLSLLEWAHRLVASVAPELTLGSPAALLKPWTIGSIPSFELSWTHGSTISLRTVRVWRPQDMERRVPPI